MHANAPDALKSGNAAPANITGCAFLVHKNNRRTNCVQPLAGKPDYAPSRTT